MPTSSPRAFNVLAEPIPRFLYDLFEVAVERAQPRFCIPSALPAHPEGRTVVVGAGKAAASMARALEHNWSTDMEGVVVTRHGHGLPCRHVEVHEGGHPVPDAEGVIATRSMLAKLDGLREGDLVICLISGGGSALLTAPPPGVTLSELQELSRALLRSGAGISEINCVRKHCSLVAGGRLVDHVRPARLVTLAISDVPGDDPSSIASGPTVPDPTTRLDALAVLERHSIVPPVGIAAWLACEAAETPKPGTDDYGSFELIASAAGSIEAAADRVRRTGLEPIVLGDDLEGEARSLARQHAALIRSLRRERSPARPRILISGGETSVKVKGGGTGGRNGEYALALALAMADETGVFALAADTDGIDGTGRAAGACIWPQMLDDAAIRSKAVAALSSCDSHGFFSSVGGLVETGPTHTNVNDFRAVLIDEAPQLRNIANGAC